MIYIDLSSSNDFSRRIFTRVVSSSDFSSIFVKFSEIDPSDVSITSNRASYMTCVFLSSFYWFNDYSIISPLLVISFFTYYIDTSMSRRRVVRACMVAAFSLILGFILSTMKSRVRLRLSVTVVKRVFNSVIVVCCVVWFLSNRSTAV